MKDITSVDGIEIVKDKYKCNKDGKIYEYNDKTDSYKEKNTTHNNIGYEQVSLRLAKGDRKTFFVHRVIANTFIKSLTSSKTIVNHKDSNIKNNKLSNLELMSRSDNMKHMHDKGRHVINKKK